MGYNYTDFNYEVARGDAAEITGVVDLAGVPQNITGWSVRFTGRTAIPAGTVVNDTGATFAYAVGSGITITSAANGQVLIAISGADTYGLAAGDTVLLCDMQVVDGAGRVRTITTGKITIKGEITRATT